MQLTNTFLVEPIVNILVMFYQLLTWAHIPYALGFAIILLTVFIRLLMWSITSNQLLSAKKMQSLTPHMAKIKEKHKGDPRRQQEATMALYREHNINPLAGCLPLIIQMVVLVFGLYPALYDLLKLPSKEIVAAVNNMLYFPSLQLTQAWNTDFFGLSLGKTPEQLLATVGPVVFLIPILTGLFQFVQSKMMMTPTPANAVTVKNSNKPDDFATTFQKQSLYLLPVMIGFFSYYFFVGLSLYWNTFTIFGIIQQYIVVGWGGAQEWIEKLKKKK